MTRDSRPSPDTDADTTSRRWSELKALFDSALLLDSAERQTFIERRCGKDGELRGELESLLKAYDETGEFLEQPVGSLKRAGVVVVTHAEMVKEEQTSELVRRIVATNQEAVVAR